MDVVHVFSIDEVATYWVNVMREMKFPNPFWVTVLHSTRIYVGLEDGIVDSTVWILLQDNWSALLCAAKEGYADICMELLEHGADIEHRDMV
jgi:hypothetical protein